MNYKGAWGSPQAFFIPKIGQKRVFLEVKLPVLVRMAGKQNRNSRKGIYKNPFHKTICVSIMHFVCIL